VTDGGGFNRSRPRAVPVARAAVATDPSIPAFPIHFDPARVTESPRRASS